MSFPLAQACRSRSRMRSTSSSLAQLFYLKGSAETFRKRLEGNNNPLLEGDNQEEKIKKLLKQRDPIYHKFADIEVVTGVKPFEELIKEIESKLP